MSDQDIGQLMELLREQYEHLDDGGEIEISPALLASKVMDKIDRKQRSPIMVRLAAVLELRQLARSICRKRVIGEDEDERAPQLFEQLQPRYPAVRKTVEVYVLREHLTYAERLANIHRLRSEAAAKAQHADALESETEQLVLSGKLTKAA